MTTLPDPREDLAPESVKRRQALIEAALKGEKSKSTSANRKSKKTSPMSLVSGRAKAVSDHLDEDPADEEQESIIPSKVVGNFIAKSKREKVVVHGQHIGKLTLYSAEVRTEDQVVVLFQDQGCEWVPVILQNYELEFRDKMIPVTYVGVSFTLPGTPYSVLTFLRIPEDGQQQ